MNVIASLKSTDGGTVTLVDDGSILVEGKYFVIKNNSISNGNCDIKADAADILRVGIRKYYASSKLIGALALFGGAAIAKGIQKSVLDSSDSVVTFAGEVASGANAVSGITDIDAVNDIGSTMSSVSSDVSAIAEASVSILKILAMILFVLSIVGLLIFIPKRLAELNHIWLENKSICPQCGNEITENEKFCTKCGNRVR